MVFRIAPLMSGAGLCGPSGVLRSRWPFAGKTFLARRLLSVPGRAVVCHPMHNKGGRPPIMDHSLKGLLSVLRPKQIEESRFQALSQDMGYPQLFGGQLMGQAVASAGQTLKEPWPLHSFHCYFLRPGRPELPLFYEVDGGRDGRTFAVRKVQALQKVQAQQGERVLFECCLSFHKPEQGFVHQRALMPEVPPPEQLLSASTHLGATSLTGAAAEAAAGSFPVEARPVLSSAAVNSRPTEPVQHIWLRANGQLPEDPHIHHSLLTYASDFNLLATCLKAQDFTEAAASGLKVASLDHAMWFHRAFRMDEWLLHSMESPVATGARGLVRGQVFNREGVLIASSTQEGLIRSND